MVYIARDGTVHQGPRPWGVDRVKETFWSFVNAVELFFTTLLPIFGSSDRAVGYRSSSDSSPSSRTNRRPNESRGGFRTMSDIRPPPPAFGGCAGGSCGR